MARPLPALTPTTEYFWRSGADGRLQILQCEECGLWLHPPSPVCRRCLSRQVSPQAVSGRGVVHAYTINHHPWRPDLDAPFVIASVELSEQPGLLLTTNIVGCDPDEVHVGLPVMVEFLAIEDIWIPLFTPRPGDQKESE